jgi:hypothetical protein
MGGSGSGRYPTTYSYTVEDCNDLDISRMIRRGWTKPGYRTIGTLVWEMRFSGRETGSIGHDSRMDLDPPHIRVDYTWRKKNYDYEIYLTTTTPNFGGVRFWFICPLCQSRVRKLYGPPNSAYFFCRTCHNLTYRSCRDSHRFDKLYERMGRRFGVSGKEIERIMKRPG